MASINFSLDGVVNGMVRFLRGKGYIRNLKKNLNDLKREMKEINAIQDDVQNKIAREHKTGDRQTLQTVQLWLTDVESINRQFTLLFNVEPIQVQLLCLFDTCSKNGCSSYKYGKKVYLLLEEAKKLKPKGHFEEVTEQTLRSVEVEKLNWEGNFGEASTSASRYVMEERPIGDTIGQEIMLKTAWNRIMEDGVGIMGLHGMGGVGKTTLFKKIHNKFVGMTDRFDIVIWVVVSQGATITKLQYDIAKKLNLSETWGSKNESDKAAEMYTYLQKKKFVLMLDDIWEKVDLQAIGVPNPTRENGCKVAFTTRSQEVCKQMKDHKPLQVNCLEKDEAWKLFKKTIGDDALERDNEIMVRAKKVAEKCGGLPLALCVIGETMSSKTKIQEWDHALDVLTTSAAEFSDMENKILPILKFSYDNLVDEHIRSCFLYCALFEEDARIEKEKLIDYWICEGFMGEYQVLERAKNKAYDVLGILVRANLLIEEVDIIHRNMFYIRTMQDVVVMHDVVREMALWIASKFGKQKETFVVQTNVGLSEVPKVNDWTAVTRMSLMCNNIKEITCGSMCPQLITLLLQNNGLKNLSGKFIRSMQKLVVLDLSKNYELSELPKKISKLVSLQYLDSSSTNIKRLPVGFQKLKKLIQLNLSDTLNLRSIRGISKLSSLKILKLQDSEACEDVSLVKELQLLEKLEFLTIKISTELVLQRISSDQRLANRIETLKIRDFKQTPLDISLLMSMKNLRELFVITCHNWEMDLSDSTIPCFTKLSTVTIVNCDGIKDLTWLLFTPNLVSLSICSSTEVRQIINKEKATDFIGITPFQKLRYMELGRLPKLESIYWSPLPFPLLKQMKLDSVPKLRKLPLNSTSVQRVHEFKIRISLGEQKTDLEWEDEDTENRFLPLCTETHLSGLAKLESIYWSPLPLLILKTMKLDSVSKLSKLPLDATSVQRVDKFITEMILRKQKTDLEWEDKETRDRFLHSFKQVYYKRAYQDPLHRRKKH